jgi:hypothetical protein
MTTGVGWAGRLYRRRRMLLMQLLSTLLGVVLALVCLELVLRIVAAATSSDVTAELARAARLKPQPVHGDCRSNPQSALGDLVQPSADPERVYELKPNIHTCFKDVVTRTSAEGLRAERSYQRPKPPGVYRILLLGDSFVFAWGMEYEQTFGALLEHEIARQVPSGVTVEVINLGTPGYNTWQQAAAFRHVGSSYQPDCVLILFYSDDLALPHLLLDRPDPLTLKTSFVGEKVQRFWPSDPSAPLQAWFQISDGDLAVFVPELALDQVPARYRHMVGLPAYRAALRTIVDVARTSGTTVVNLADYRQLEEQLSSAQLAAGQAELGIVRPEFRFPFDPRHWLTPDDPHLSVAGNVELEQRIMTSLRQVGRCLGPTR